MITDNTVSIRTEKLLKRFQIDSNNFFYAVKDVNLEIVKGEIVLISGPNGSGKTTLLSMLGGMIKPSSGSISVLNNIVTEMNQKQLTLFRKQCVGFIFQTFRLIDALSVIENIELVLNLNGAKRPESLQTAKSLLDELNILQKSHCFPEVLSGGEKQRVAIARSLANNSEIILADEPTGNLDSKAGEDTIDLLSKIAKESKKTVVIVSHDSRIYKFADRLLQMEDGRIL